MATSAGTRERRRDHPPRVAVFGHDCTESTLIKRIKALQNQGLEVLGFTFRRAKFNRDYAPEWDDTELGVTVDRRYLLRLLRLVQALPVLVRARRRLRAVDFLYARNIDMAALALVARTIASSRAPLVYEVLDVQRVFTSSGLVPFLFRLAERLVLRACALQVVSSPAFMTRYFVPVQGYAGRWFLLENKIAAPASGRPLRRATPAAPGGPPCPPDGPWVIAWLGNLRCPKSPELLCRIARRMGPRVRIHVHGFPTETGLERFQAAIAGHDNIVYFGEYRSPRDLPSIYDRAHFAWAFDYLDHGTNSAWLLPNRLYEGCYHGTPALTAKGTETGRRVAEQGLGWTFEEPVEAAVAEFLGRMDASTWLRVRRHLLSLPGELFVDQGDTALLCRRVLGEALPGEAELDRRLRAARRVA